MVAIGFAFLSFSIANRTTIGGSDCFQKATQAPSHQSVRSNPLEPNALRATQGPRFARTQTGFNVSRSGFQDFPLSEVAPGSPATRKHEECAPDQARVALCRATYECAQDQACMAIWRLGQWPLTGQ